MIYQKTREKSYNESRGRTAVATTEAATTAAPTVAVEVSESRIRVRAGANFHQWQRREGGEREREREEGVETPEEETKRRDKVFDLAQRRGDESRRIQGKERSNKDRFTVYTCTCVYLSFTLVL